jgi:hypothetical protein
MRASFLLMSRIHALPMTPKRGDGQGQPGDVVITAGRPELRFEHGVLPSLPPREFQYAFDVQMC